MRLGASVLREELGIQETKVVCISKWHQKRNRKDSGLWHLDDVAEGAYRRNLGNLISSPVSAFFYYRYDLGQSI